ncbi:MAG: hypothetical protein BJ554DRAFT_5479, partial [Olpidium bornovanus]
MISFPGRRPLACPHISDHDARGCRLPSSRLTAHSRIWSGVGPVTDLTLILRRSRSPRARHNRTARRRNVPAERAPGRRDSLRATLWFCDTPESGAAGSSAADRGPCRRRDQGNRSLLCLYEASSAFYRRVSHLPQARARHVHQAGSTVSGGDPMIVATGDVTVRSATPADCELIHRFVTELAAYEKAADKVLATPDSYRATLFGDRPYAHVAIGSLAGEDVGMALYYFNYVGAR